ncbi:leucine-rich_repeat domain-containing protein [Hexamita inflata]|uniref:Leucine-rich repeat domain-containing protein n=1 Tax=Hexamita inflata TaxID=28002 RepID=A0AA86Q5E2_9EUKA|nr:leucine-rich repeat domain-containing protein [Hexamita inflata]
MNAKVFEVLRSQVSNGELKLEENENVQNLLFIDELNVAKISLYGMKNVKFDVCPENVKELIIEECFGICLTGIDQMKLSVLQINNCNINSLEPLRKLTELQQLELQYNKINDISILKNFQSITSLSLAYNRITDISVLENLNMIQSLNLNFNKIQNIKALKNLNSTVEQQLDQRYP